jgi:hypothetical protein
MAARPENLLRLAEWMGLRFGPHAGTLAIVHTVAKEIGAA